MTSPVLLSLEKMTRFSLSEHLFVKKTRCKSYFSILYVQSLFLVNPFLNLRKESVVLIYNVYRMPQICKGDIIIIDLDKTF